jgi:hypothetical protein
VCFAVLASLVPPAFADRQLSAMAPSSKTVARAESLTRALAP